MNTVTQSRDSERTTVRQAHSGQVIFVLALAGMTASFMQTILIPIQGDLPHLLDASRSATAWVITITLLVSAICTPISGRLGDMFGKRRVEIVLLGLLVVGSAVAALSASAAMLIVGRGLQGLGMGVIPLGISILRDTVRPARLDSATALLSATVGVGGAIGLPLSALVAEYLDWHFLFWGAAALSALVLILVICLVPESPQRTGGRVDLIGVAGLAIGLSGILIAISRGSDWGWTSPLTLGTLVAGVLVLVIWGVIELRMEDPLVDLRVNARGAVLLTNLASAILGFSLFASQIAFPQLLELPATANGIGLSLVQASFILMPSGIIMLAMSPISGLIERRWGAKPLLVSGAAIIAIGYVIAVIKNLGAGDILAINILIGIGIGIGLGYAALPTLIMGAVPPTQTGAANGLNTLMRAMGTAVASAVVGAALAGSSTTVGTQTYPSSHAFDTAYWLGLGAAIVCVLIAAAIPTRTARRNG